MCSMTCPEERARAARSTDMTKPVSAVRLLSSPAMRASTAILTLSLAACGTPVSHGNAPRSSASPPASTTVAPDPDEAFKRGAIAFAARSERFIEAWGTTRLDGVHPSRFTVLRPTTTSKSQRGAYLFELAPGRVVAVTFAVDGRTREYAAGDGLDHGVASLPFAARGETAIAHEGGHHHGGETFTFGLRNGKLVLFDYALTDDITDKTERPVHESFATNRVCVTPCPALTSHSYADSELAVSAEAASIEEIVEPVPAPVVGQRGDAFRAGKRTGLVAGEVP